MRRLVLIFAVACGGNTAPPLSVPPAEDASTPPPPVVTSATPPPSSFDFCKEQEARDKRCEREHDAASCQKMRGCYEQYFRPAAADKIERCVTGRDCNVSDDSCFREAAEPFASDPDVVTYRKECETLRMQCSTILNKDFCGPEVGVLRPESLSGFRQCIAKGCGVARTCLQDLVKAMGCK
jgi:hypothetical protein